MDKLFLQNLMQITPDGDNLKNGKTTGKADKLIFQSRVILGDMPINVTLHPRFIKFPLHGHDYTEMMYVVSGSITHLVNGKPIVIKEGNLLLLNKFTVHEVLPAGENDVGLNVILSDAFLSEALQNKNTNDVLYGFIAENLKKDGTARYLNFDVNDNYLIRNLLDNIVYTVIEKNENDLLPTPKLVSLLFDYLSLHADLLSFDSMPVGAQTEFVSAVDAYVSTHYRTASLIELAKNLNLSNEHLCRKIFKSYGKTFKDLVIDKRLLTAENLLIKTDKNVEEIATSVGYENVGYFYKIFRKKHGTTPTKWRKTLVDLS